jgi:RNA polymerase sigma factor (TIGR02999 family)
MRAGPDLESATRLLHQGRDGDPESLHQFLRLVYPALKQLADSALRGEWRSKTTQRTLVVHEALLRLFRRGWQRIPWQTPAEFFAGAAREMRQVVVELARRRNALKRGADYTLVPLDQDARVVSGETLERLIIVNDALAALEKAAPRCARIVELLFFGSLSKAEAACVMGIHVRTVERDWQFARAFLQTVLSEPALARRHEPSRTAPN